jgi:NAD+ synthase
MGLKRPFSSDVLALDPEKTAEAIETAIRRQVTEFHRRGVVLGLSGGVDSSVVTCLCVRALGAERVHVLLMPERDSSDESLQLARLLTSQLGVTPQLEDIEPILTSAGCYARQAEAIRMVFPEYGDGYKCKVTLPSILKDDRLSVSALTIESPAGTRQTSRMTPLAYQQLIAATNFKQRARKMIEYYHADRLN